MMFFVNGKLLIPNMNYSSMAYDLDTKEFLYSEEHSEFNINKSKIWQTNYKNSDGEIITSRTIKLGSDSLRPDYQLEDFRSGYIEGAEKLSGGRLHIYTRESFGNEIERDTIKINDQYIIDAGLTFFFRENWVKLLNNEMLYFYFVAPAKLDYFSFRVYLNKTHKINGTDAVELILEPSSFIIRQFVSPIFISYHMETKKILQYKGISNINDSNGSSYNVLINYLTNLDRDELWKD